MTALSDFAFLHPLRVRWSECDAQGIVFNVNYLLYYDIAVWEWTRALGYQRENAPEFLTVHVESTFRGSALFDEEIDVGLRASYLGEKSLRVAGAVFRGGALLNEGAIAYVHVKKGTRETAPLPEEFLDRVLAFEKTRPERKRA